MINHGWPNEAKGFIFGINESQTLYNLVKKQLINHFFLIYVDWLNYQTYIIKYTQPNADLAVINFINLLINLETN